LIEPAALLAWSALALIVTLTPGPDTLLVAAHAARGGFRAGMATVAGIMTGLVWYGSLIAFGALSILAAVPALFLAVKIAGALYLAWLGIGMIRRALVPAASSRQTDDAGKMPAVRLDQPYAQGFFTNALNPKVALFYLAALPQFATGPNAPTIGILLLAIHAAFGLAWLSFIAFAAARARALVWNSAAQREIGRWLEGAVGVFFVGVAGRLALAQAR
jgi:threonine/homoserine/homoserine lactone efflux protein